MLIKELEGLIDPERQEFDMDVQLDEGCWGRDLVGDPNFFPRGFVK